jgi:hypothetical protein
MAEEALTTQTNLVKAWRKDTANQPVILLPAQYRASFKSAPGPIHGRMLSSLIKA